ncbi:hypothetical protein LZ189_12995 [Rhodovulum sulfidophilum]|nr:hypothetical protein [Rhodovulum sulfidophilum]
MGDNKGETRLDNSLIVLRKLLDTLEAAGVLEQCLPLFDGGRLDDLAIQFRIAVSTRSSESVKHSPVSLHSTA